MKRQLADTSARLELRHRNPIARDYLIVSRVVLLGYPQVSDGAKLTYWVVYSHDWYVRDRGRKGYAFPTVGRLARLRHTSERTIQRHLNELIDAGLLTREFRPGAASVLYIEEPSGDPVVDHEAAGSVKGGDASVGGVVTPVSPPHKKEEPKKENSVNAASRLYGEGTRQASEPRPLRDLLPQLSRGAAGRDRRDWLAGEMLDRLGDQRSLACYRAIAARCPESVVFEALALVKDAARGGHIRKSAGALFLTIIRRLCAERRLPNPLPDGGAVSGTASRQECTPRLWALQRDGAYREPS